MPTVVKVRRWGNSLAVRLPKAFAAERAIDDGTIVRIDDLEITGPPRSRRSRYKLRNLLKNYTPPPTRIDFPPVGKELL